MNIQLIPPVSGGIALLEQAGFEAYAVGGCVRDLLLGRIPGDWDITTSARPEETEAVFAGYPVIETGIRHGTVTVIFDGEPLEITTFRVESTYSDSRHPDSVAFSRNLRDDLSRRDFTVNALAYSPRTGLVDCFGGIEDLRRGRIVCVGNPVERFTEDALRILRAVRFASQLGFSIEAETSKALYAVQERLIYVSAERKAVEIRKLLSGKNAAGVLSEYASLLRTVIPVSENAPDMFARLPESAGTSLRFACTMEYLDGEAACDVLRGLKLDNDTIQSTARILDAKTIPLPQTFPDIRRFFGKYGEYSGDILIFLNLCGAEDSQISDIRAGIERIRTERLCCTVSELAVNGRDIAACGFKGVQIGAALQKVLDAVIDGKIQNTKCDIMEYIMESDKE